MGIEEEEQKPIGGCTIFCLHFLPYMLFSYQLQESISLLIHQLCGCTPIDRGREWAEYNTSHALYLTTYVRSSIDIKLLPLRLGTPWKFLDRKDKVEADAPERMMDDEMVMKKWSIMCPSLFRLLHLPLYMAGPFPWHALATFVCNSRLTLGIIIFTRILRSGAPVLYSKVKKSRFE